MKTLETGQDKISKICDKLRRETLEPAKDEAHLIIEAAKKKADEIILEAEKHAEQIIKNAKGQIEQERNVFHSSMQQASKQAVEALKQDIEQHVFNQELHLVLEKQLADPKVIAQLINGIVKALENEGLSVDLTAVIPKTVSAQEVSALLLDAVQKRLKNKPLEIGNFSGGVQLKLQGKRMTIDLTEQALKELLSNYVRKDFRQLIFSH
ncbi:MAG: V-type ATP synthase subunit E [Parachlamydiaceae bacterium]|nr:V-type ATP synthase subunit E [Parachlamydiaceae bacterium]